MRYTIRFILTMRNVNTSYFKDIYCKYNCFILTMRNVNKDTLLDRETKERFYLNYEECKYIVQDNNVVARSMFYLNYEECK
ncbi:MAG: hypothetical protein ACRCWG_05205 [Sarcina sp.]